MPGPIVHLIYAKASGEVYNRRAALGSAIRTIAQLLRATGHVVYINGQAYEDVLGRPERTHLPLRSASARMRALPFVVRQGLRDLRMLRGHRRLVTALKACPRPDAILEISSTGSDVGLRYSRATGAPLAFLFDAPVLDELVALNGKRPPWASRWARREASTIRHARRIIVFSPRIAEDLSRAHGVDRGRFVIHHSIDFDRLAVPAHDKPDPNVPRVLYLGSFLRWHGVPMLIEAFDRIKRNGVPGTLTLVGEGEDLARCESIVARLETRASFRFEGYLDHDALGTAKMRAHIGVVPRIPWYSAPVKSFEYAAAGMAILAPGHEVIEYLRGQGLPITTFTPDSPDDFQSKLEALMRSCAKIAEGSAALRERTMRTYNAEKDAAFFSDFIAQTMRDPNRSVGSGSRATPWEPK